MDPKDLAHMKEYIQQQRKGFMMFFPVINHTSQSLEEILAVLMDVLDTFETMCLEPDESERQGILDDWQVEADWSDEDYEEEDEDKDEEEQDIVKQ